ncbi:MAG: RNA polymerase sigma factor [bacterium]|nr:RNA polymerase sigma factor [bacterium]
MQEIPDEVVRKAARGDAAAFERIYRASADYVYTIAVGITGNGADAEEVAQDVFLTVHRKLRRFRFRSSFKTWLYRVAVNRALGTLRKTSRRRARQVEYDDDASYGVERGGAAAGAEREDDRRRLEALLGALNPDQRACIVLREIEGMRYAEIAETLGVNINTVRTRLKRAREILLTLRPDGGEEG